MTQPMKNEKVLKGKILPLVQKRVNIECLTAYPLKGLLISLVLGSSLGTWISGAFSQLPELIRVAHCS